MVKFNEAEKLTAINEGGYANNPHDKGGETYAGIARKFWANWAGWKTIDAIKAQFGTSASIINKYAKSDAVLHWQVSSFYKKNFWDVNNLDSVNDQQLANNVYDFGVNSGTGRAAKFLQQAANDTEMVKLTVDGAIGPQTIKAINGLNTEEVYHNFNARREAFYRSIAKGDQAQFLKSWLSRIKPYKKCVS